MKRHSLPVSMLLCGVLFMACEKEDIVEDAPTYGVHYQLVTSNPSTLLGGTIPVGINNSTLRTATTVSWASGSAVARRIRFEGTGDDEVDIRTATPHQINLLGPATTLGMLAIPAGEYEDVRFTIELSDTDPFLLTGDYSGTPIVLQVDPPISFAISQDRLTVSQQTNYNALTTLNLSHLLNGITADLFSEAVVSNGQILISPASNQRLYDLILANMTNLGELEFAVR